MKKMIALLLAVLMAAAFVPGRVSAELVDLAPDNVSHIRTADSLPAKTPGSMDRLLASLGSTDQVTIDEENSTYTVVTAEGLKLTAVIPFGAVCLTQDILQQLELYGAVYQDFNGAYQRYLRDNVHMNIYDMFTNLDVFITSTENSLSTLVGSTSSLSESEKPFIAKFISTNWYDGADVETVQLGDTIYFWLDLRADYGYVVFEAFEAGQDITIYSFIDVDDEESLEEMKEILTDLVLEAV